MNRKIVKLSTVTLILTVILSSLIVINKVALAQPRPKLFVSPAVNTFYTNQTAVGATFKVNVSSADWGAPGVFGYEFKLHYDTSMLEAVADGTELPTDHWLKPTIKATNIIVVDGGTIDAAAGTVSFAASMLAPEEGKTGGGNVATIVLKITKAPPTGGNVTSLLTIGEDTFVDPTATPYPATSYDKVPGTFTYGSPPLALPVLSVDSQEWDMPTATAAGGLFNISVRISGLVADWHVIAFQVAFTFNETLIQSKDEWVFEGGFAKSFGDTAFSGYIGYPDYPEGSVIVAQLVLPTWPDPADLAKWMHGDGIIATIQFNATFRPTPVASCDLALIPKDTYCVDYQGAIVKFSALNNGLYRISLKAPWLSIDPKAYAAKVLGEQFNVSISMNELDKGYKLVGAQFVIHYNTTLLGTTEDLMFEGDFMKDFATRAGTNTFFQAWVDEGSGIIGIIILPLDDGMWPENVFPEGTGALATITFNATYQHPTEDISNTLEISTDPADLILADVNAKRIDVDFAKTAEEGTMLYTIGKAIPAFPGGIDLFTQYNAPYGGQGSNNPSDAFAPQGQVKLYSSVTYRGEPVPSKPVTYHMTGPSGFELSAIQFTDEDGTSLLGFTVPWDVDFGLWNVSASVDIAGNVVSDMLFFRVGWLIEVRAVTITPNDGTKQVNSNVYQQLFKGKSYDLNVSLKVITMQDPTACLQLQGISPKTIIVYTGIDELKQPIFTKFIEMPIGAMSTTDPSSEQMKAFVLNADGRTKGNGKVSIEIPKTAFTGVATIYTNVLTAYPSGVAYNNPETGKKEVWISRQP